MDGLGAAAPILENELYRIPCTLDVGELLGQMVGCDGRWSIISLILRSLPNPMPELL